MSKVARKVITDGDYHEVACALDAEGGSPAREFLEALGRGYWEPDPDAESLPDDAQMKDADRFIDWCQRLAMTGLPPERRHGAKYLQYGIWEFRVGAKRLTFYDTPGDGTFDPKAEIQDIRTTPFELGHPCWWWPDMDVFIRLGHAFPKVSQKTLTFDLNEAEKIREEDLQYDQ